MKPDTDAIDAGARNLLQNCAGVAPGDRVLLVGEDTAMPWFEPALCEAVAATARSLGAEPRIVMAPPGANAKQFPTAVAEAMQDAEYTIFFSRLGDHLRFLETPGQGRKIMCYTITLAHLAAPFAVADHRAMLRVYDRIVHAIEASRHYDIRAACGTALRGQIDSGSGDETMTGFSLELFPVMIFPPLNASRLNGRLVLQRFLTSTSTREYADSAMHLASPVVTEIEDNRIVTFDGKPDIVAAVERQLERAAALTGGDPWRINSWHTGLNPFTFFEGDPYADLEYWGTVAYGSPRYTHIHTAGKDPGDLCVHLFDASIRFDDRQFWDEGRLLLLDEPDLRAGFSDPALKPDSELSYGIGI